MLPVYGWVYFWILELLLTTYKFHFETFSHWYIELLLNVYIHVTYQEYMSNGLLYTQYVSAH